MNNVYVINKPLNYTSRDVVNVVSKQLKTKSVGHCGTLDPLATGVLVICVDDNLKFIQFLLDDHKKYRVRLYLGKTTETLDNEGVEIIYQDYNGEENQIIDVLKSYVKSYEQVVPKYSAVKVDGKRLYDYARNNQEVDLPSRLVTINELDNINVEIYEKHCIVEYDCAVSKGTYIRSLCRDIALSLNTVGYMDGLVRIEQGLYTLADTCELNDLKPVDLRLSIKTIEVEEEIYDKIKHGQKLSKIFDDNEVMLTYQNELIAVYVLDENFYRAKRVFIRGDR